MFETLGNIIKFLIINKNSFDEYNANFNCIILEFNYLYSLNIQ